MKAVAEMSLQELAAWVSGHLWARGIQVVLVGVSVYSENRYQTSDLDFVERYHTQRQQLRVALAEIGFAEKNSCFLHPEAKWFLEFPTGPLAVGDSPIEELGEVPTEQGVLVLLTPTDCVKDRLSAYFHWRDRQALDQAVWVAQHQRVDIEAVRQWSEQEGMPEKFGHFLAALAAAGRQL